MVLPCPSRSAARWPPALPELRLAVAIADAIERLDLLEAVIDVAELLAQPLDVAVDGAVVDIDGLAVGRVHELVAVLNMARPLRQRLQRSEEHTSELQSLMRNS